MTKTEIDELQMVYGDLDIKLRRAKQDMIAAQAYHSHLVHETRLAWEKWQQAKLEESNAPISKI